MSINRSYGISTFVGFVALACMLAVLPSFAHAYNQSYYYGYGEGYYYGYGQGYYYGYGQGYYYGYGQGYYYGQATYYSQASYQTVFTKNVAALSSFAVTGSISKGSGTFVIDHPLDPKNKLLFHSFVESPDVKDLYDGIARLDRNGEAIVVLPDYFDALNKDVRYQLKPIGAPMPNLHIKEEEKNNRFVIGGGVPGGKVSWQLTGIRHDAYIEANPIVPEVQKGPTRLVDRGQYLFAGYVTERTFYDAPFMTSYDIFNLFAQ